MNRLLVYYCVAVQHPEVSGTEHLEMLQIRDRLAELESTLTSEEQQALAEASGFGNPPAAQAIHSCVAFSMSY
jgi:hypothetical protein